MKLYIITRADLPAGAQVAQSCHAMRLFSEQHPEIDREWYAASNNLVCLSVDDEEELKALCRRLTINGIEHSKFHEPDFNDALTAVAVEPEGCSLLGSLPLALRAA